jgi:tetratricopeptide (TPR) repeat protein
MKKNISYLSLLLSLIIVSCADLQEEVKTEKGSATIVTDTVATFNEDPQELLKDAYQLFKEGNDEASIAIANKVLKIGYENNNDTLIGGALASLCRNSQRSQDTVRLAELSEELATLAETSGNQKWMMIRAHMNAEMWRLIGDMDRAEDYYNESMKISFAINSMGMYTIDHFNKSFVSTAKGDFVEARRLIKKYYALREEADPNSEDAYGLIALAYLLEQEKNYKGAHEVAVVTRRLFQEQNLFPEPPDEKPLIMVEEKVKSVLDEETISTTAKKSEKESVGTLIEKYL